jgi:hypothetical protein
VVDVDGALGVDEVAVEAFGLGPLVAWEVAAERPVGVGGHLTWPIVDSGSGPGPRPGCP